MKDLPKDVVDMLTDIANTQIEPHGWGSGAMPSSEDCYDDGYGDGRIELAREVVKSLGIKVDVRDPDPDNDEKCMICDQWFPPGEVKEADVPEGTFAYEACSDCRAKKS